MLTLTICTEFYYGCMSISGNGKLHTKSGEVPVAYTFVETSDGMSGSVTQTATTHRILNGFWNITLEDGSEQTFQKYNETWDKVAFIARP
jgi:hypothetical protein